MKTIFKLLTLPLVICLLFCGCSADKTKKAAGVTVTSSLAGREVLVGNNPASSRSLPKIRS